MFQVASFMGKLVGFSGRCYRYERCCFRTCGIRSPTRSMTRSTTTILLILLILILIGVIPAWPHSRQWGYGPSGGIGLVVVILLVLLVMGVV